MDATFLAKLGPLPAMLFIAAIFFLIYLSEKYLHPVGDRWLDKFLAKFFKTENEEPKGYHKLDARAKELEHH
jgi:hypothetical protein